LLQRRQAFGRPLQQGLAIECSVARMRRGCFREQGMLREPAHRSDLEVGLPIQVLVGETEAIGLANLDELPHELSNPSAALNFLSRDRRKKGVERGVEQ